jgi:hypothetical protein
VGKKKQIIEGRKIRALTEVINLLMEEVEQIFYTSEVGKLNQDKADLLREILWRNLERAFYEGSSESHGLELKIEFLEKLLQDKRNKIEAKDEDDKNELE